MSEFLSTDQFLIGETLISPETDLKKKQIYVFDGHGSEHLGMTKEIYESFPYVRKICKMADISLGYGLTDIMHNGPSEELRKHRQTAITLASIIYFYGFTRTQTEDTMIKPDFIAGESLGYLLTMLHSGSLSRPEEWSNGWIKTLNLAEKREQVYKMVLAETPKTIGMVLARGHVSEKEFEEILDVLEYEFSVYANVVAPERVTFCGTKENIAKASEKYLPELEKKGMKSRVFPKEVPPFHTPYMEPAIGLLKKYVPIHDPKNIFPFVYDAQIPIVTNSENPARKLIKAKDLVNEFLNMIPRPIRMDAIFDLILQEKIERIYNIGDKNRFLRSLLSIAVDEGYSAGRPLSKQIVKQTMDEELCLKKYPIAGKRGELVSLVTSVDIPIPKIAEKRKLLKRAA